MTEQLLKTVDRLAHKFAKESLNSGKEETVQMARQMIFGVVQSIVDEGEKQRLIVYLEKSNSGVENLAKTIQDFLVAELNEAKRTRDEASRIAKGLPWVDTVK